MNQIIIPQLKECGSKKRDAYRKPELVKLAVEKLKMKKTDANALKVEDLCKLLFGKLRPPTTSIQSKPSPSLRQEILGAPSGSLRQEILGAPSGSLRQEILDAPSGSLRQEILGAPSGSLRQEILGAPRRGSPVRSSPRRGSPVRRGSTRSSSSRSGSSRRGSSRAGPSNTNKMKKVRGRPKKIQNKSPRKQRLNQSDLKSFIQKKEYNQCLLKEIKFIQGPKIGEGGYGKVYEYSYRGNKFIIKSISKKDISAIEVFIFSSARHPNLLCSAKTIFKGKKLEFLLPKAKSNLLPLIRNKKTNKIYSFEEKQRVLNEVIKGVYFLHTKLHIVHCDLKPDNILLFENGEVKITDFGLACLLLDREEFTLDHHVLTNGYKNPLILLSEPETVSYSTDIWSLGILAFELFFDVTMDDIFYSTPNQLINKYGQKLGPQLAIIKDYQNKSNLFTEDPFSLILPVIRNSDYTDYQQGLLTQFFGLIFDVPIPVNYQNRKDLFYQQDKVRPTIQDITQTDIFRTEVRPSFSLIGYSIEPPINLIPDTNINISKFNSYQKVIGLTLPKNQYNQIQKFITNLIENNDKKSVDYSMIVEYLPCMSTIINGFSDRKFRTAEELYEEYIPLVYKLLEDEDIQSGYFSCIPNIDEILDQI